MSELYRHLLIPQSATFVPELDKISHFLEELGTLGALPNEAKYRVITRTGKTRAIATNANTGEVYYGPELKVSRHPALHDAVASITRQTAFDLVAEGKGPATIEPFELYSADSYAARRPGVLWNAPYTFSVRCNLRQKMTHFLHSPFGCKCEINPTEPGIFQNPWNDLPVQTSALGCASFWIEFGIGDWLMPMVTDTLEILDPRVVALANRVFAVEFSQGCIRNDD